MTNGETGLRVATGAFAIRGLLQGIYGTIIFFELLDSIPNVLGKANAFMSLQLSSTLLSSSSSLSSSSPNRDGIITFMFIFALNLSLHFVMDILALVGAIKRWDAAMKGAFGLWMFMVVWSTLGVLGLVFGRRTPEEDEVLMSIVLDYLMSLAYGAAMYQYRQLLKGQTDDEESRAPLLGASR